MVPNEHHEILIESISPLGVKIPAATSKFAILVSECWEHRVLVLFQGGEVGLFNWNFRADPQDDTHECCGQESFND